MQSHALEAAHYTDWSEWLHCGPQMPSAVVSGLHFFLAGDAGAAVRGKRKEIKKVLH